MIPKTNCTLIQFITEERVLEAVEENLMVVLMVIGTTIMSNGRLQKNTESYVTKKMDASHSSIILKMSIVLRFKKIQNRGLGMEKGL